MRNRGGGSGSGTRGDLATAAESDVELALALGVGRRRVVPFVGESPGVERREADCVRCVRDELEARSVVVDAERELADPLGYGDGRDSERAGLPEGTGGVKGRSSPPGREMSRSGAGEPCAEKARRLPSFVAARGCPSECAIPGVFFSKQMGERPRVTQETGVDVVGDDGDNDGDKIPWDRLATSGIACSVRLATDDTPTTRACNCQCEWRLMTDNRNVSCYLVTQLSKSQPSALFGNSHPFCPLS